MAIRTRYDNSVFVERRLSNGIRVYLQQPQMVPDEEGIIIAFLPFVGSCLDPADAHGLAHFFEHIPFDVRRLAPLSRMAGEWDGSTSGFSTEFDFRAPKDSFQETVSLLSRVLIDPPFSEKVVARERKVIAAEWRRKNASSGYLAELAKMEEFWGASHPFGHLPVGRLEVIESMTTEQLETFYHAHYHAGNIRLLCGGAFAELGEEVALAGLEKAFGGFPVAPAVSLEIAFPQRQGECSVHRDARFGRDAMSLSFYGVETLEDVDSDALHFLVDMLRGIHSPLLRELRTRRGWVYEIGLCHAEESSFGWNFGFQCASLRKRFPRIREIFRNVLAGLDPAYIVAEQRIRQLSRKNIWRHPVNECERAVYPFTMFGERKSTHRWEEIEDEQTPERVLYWRDRLLEQEPFVFEAHAG